jgi:[CysO sulfur-carrier protein]-S-L-cysteine hydrolase
VICIPRSIYEGVVRHAKKEFPAECCGILGGRNGSVQKAFEVKNGEGSSTRYSISAQEQMRVFEEMDQESMEMIATYHSHPLTPAFPSQTDVELAPYPEVTVVIISLKEVSNPVVNAFRIHQQGIDPKEIKIMEGGLVAG